MQKRKKGGEWRVKRVKIGSFNRGIVESVDSIDDFVVGGAVRDRISEVNGPALGGE